MSDKKMWTKFEVAEKLEVSDQWVQRGVVAIWTRQTADEQSLKSTHYHNGIGFNGVDAEIMSSFAEQVNRGRTLSVKQMAIARKKIKKYAGQLAEIANEG